MPSIERRNRAWSKLDCDKVKISNYGDVIGRKINKSNGNYLCFSYKGKTIYVHRIVHELFIGKIPYKYDINHKNGNKLDNYYENLEAKTRSENQIHAFKNGLNQGHKHYGEDNCNYKNGAYLKIDKKIYHKAWERAKWRGLDWKSMSVEERIKLANGKRRYKATFKN